MRRRINSILISGISGLVSLLWIIPLVWLCTTAFTKPEYSMQLFLHTRPSLNNFKYVLDIIPFWRYFINTVEIVIFTFGIQFITVSMAAYALGVMRFRGEKLMFLLIFVQLTIPNDVLILANYKTLAAMHLTDTKLGIMLPYLGSAFGTFLVRQSFKTIPVSLSEAARMDGCTTWSIIWRIYVPCSKPAFVSMGLMSVSYHWNNYLWPMVVTKPSIDSWIGDICQKQGKRNPMVLCLRGYPDDYCSVGNRLLYFPAEVYQQLCIIRH